MTFLKKNRIGVLCFAVFLLLGGLRQGQAQTETELASPSAQEMYYIQNFVAGTEPAYRELAKRDPEYNRANEFDREAVLNRLETNLRKGAEHLKSVRLLRVNVADSFGEYDPRYQEYDFTISNGSSFSFNAYGKSVELVVTNGSMAQGWRLTPAQAEDVLRRNEGSRKVTLILHLAIDDAAPGLGNSAAKMNAHILDYEIRGKGGILLGRIEVK